MCVAFVLAMFTVSSNSQGEAESDGVAPSPTSFDSADELEVWRKTGNALKQRQHVWQLIVRLTQTAPGQPKPDFESWHGEDEVFGGSMSVPPRGLRGFSHVVQGSDGFRATRANIHSQSASIPVITYTLYNPAAYDHIRGKQLNRVAELEQLTTTGRYDPDFPASHAVPSFPPDAIVLKTAWWPISPEGISAIPVWDPELNPSRSAGNPYTTWKRVVAVNPIGSAEAKLTAHVDFAGRSFDTHVVGLERFYHVVVDARMADHAMRDTDTTKAALIALGRPIKVGDILLLVGASFATREIRDWIWATLWWHDRPEQGPFAAGRPAELKDEWRNYLMQAAFDSVLPREVDGGPHICFNPWLEGRFPDGGHGSGIASNCMSCHGRASYPSIAFLPITRGGADTAKDPAYSPGRLRTSSIWSIALQTSR
jgi:hypothetical protein